MFKDLEEVRAFFAQDTFATANGITVEEWSPDGAVCAMTLRDDHRNAVGGVMGGVIYTIADFAFAVAANTDHNPTLAITANISFLTTVKGTRLIARSRRIKSGRTTSVYEVSVSDDTGREIALFTGTGYKL